MKVLSLDLTFRWEGSHQEFWRKAMSDRIQGGLVKYRRARQAPPAPSGIPQTQTGTHCIGMLCPGSRDMAGRQLVSAPWLMGQWERPQWSIMMGYPDYTSAREGALGTTSGSQEGLPGGGDMCTAARQRGRKAGLPGRGNSMCRGTIEAQRLRHGAHEVKRLARPDHKEPESLTGTSGHQGIWNRP